MTIKVNGLNKTNITQLNVIGFIEFKNKKNKFLPNTIRVVAEPLPGFSGASVFVIDEDKVYSARLYEKTLKKMSNLNLGDTFKDTSNTLYNIVDGKDFDDTKVYNETLLFL